MASRIHTPIHERQLSGKLGTLSLPRQVLFLAFWPFLEQVMSLAVGTVDLALAGRLEPEAVTLAAVDALGVAGFLNWLMHVVFSAVGTGAAALIARSIGKGRRAVARTGLGQAVALALLMGVVMGALIFTLADVLAGLMNLDGMARGFCVDYLRIMAIAAPPSAVLFIGNACLRAAGDTRTPFLVMVLVNLVNVGLSVLFVFGPGPIGGHGVLGIAAGTLVAWLIGCGMILAVLLHPRSALRLKLRRVRPHAVTMKRIVSVGAPNLLETLGGTWLATFIVLIIVGLLQDRIGGSGLIGAHMIAVRVESFSFLPAFALGIAASTLCGQYLGLGDPERAKWAVIYAWACAALPMGVMGVLFLAVPEWLIRIITDNQQLIDHARPLVQICGLIQFSFAAYLVLAMALRGAGDTRTTMRLTYASVFLFRVPAAYVLGLGIPGTGFDGFGLPGVWIGLCGDLFIRGSLFTARFLHRGWQHVKV